MAVDLPTRLQAFAKLVSQEKLLELVQAIWKNDRQFTYPAFQKTAESLRREVKSWGIESEICHIPADGKTMFGDWKMPLAWDCTAATLEVVVPRIKQRVLADRKDRPTHTVMWCGPTPPEGIVAEVVRIADAKELKAKRARIKGKIVYTPAHPLALKKILVDAGARAVVTSFCRNGKLIPDATFWFNSWSDNPGGWAFHADDTPLPGMVLSSRAGVELDALLKRGPVKLKMTVRSRYFEGTLPVVSAFVPGRSEEEVLAIGHAMEQGANDNASGCAVILESLRAIRNCSRGKLPPLRRGVRGVLTNECYGTIGYAAKNPDVIGRMLAAVNWDTIGRYQESADAVFRYHRCADASASVADTLMALLLETWLPRALPFSKVRMGLPFALTDNAYNDPDIGVACVYVDSQDRFWHTSADTPDTIHGPTLHAFAVISATYLHFLASAGAPEMLWLCEHTVREYGTRIDATANRYAVHLRAGGNAKAQTLARALDHLRYAGELGTQSLRSAERFVPPAERRTFAAEVRRLIAHLAQRVSLEQRRLKLLARCKPGKLKPLAGVGPLARLRPRKKFIGTPSYEGLPLKRAQKFGSPTWDAQLQCALFWATGELTFAEILRRVGYEFGRDNSAQIAKHFRHMADVGLLEWRR